MCENIKLCSFCLCYASSVQLEIVACSFFFTSSHKTRRRTNINRDWTETPNERKERSKNHLQVFSNYNWPEVFLSATSRRDFTSSRLMNLRSVVWFRSRRAERRWASWVWWIWPAASEPPRPERRANVWKKEATSTSEWTDSKYMKYMAQHQSINQSFTENRDKCSSHNLPEPKETTSEKHWQEKYKSQSECGE